MELVGRMMDGSIPYSVKGVLRKAGLFRGNLGQDAKIEQLSRLPLFEGCSQRQLPSWSPPIRYSPPSASR